MEHLLGQKTLLFLISQSLLNISANKTFGDSNSKTWSGLSSVKCLHKITTITKKLIPTIFKYKGHKNKLIILHYDLSLLSLGSYPFPTVPMLAFGPLHQRQVREAELAHKVILVQR